MSLIETKPNRATRAMKILWSLTAIYWLTIFTLTHLPPTRLPQTHVSDKVEHFTAYFILATLLNIVPAILAQPVPLEVGVVVGVHLIFIVRVLMSKHVASRQRAADLARFRELKDAGR